MPSVLTSLFQCGSGAAVLMPCLLTLQVLLLFLSFIALLSVITVSSLKDQYGCRYLCISDLVGGQLQSMSSNNIPMCLLSSTANLVSSAVHALWYTQALLHCVDGIALVWNSFVFMWWLCLNSPSAVNSYAQYSYIVLMCS